MRPTSTAWQRRSAALGSAARAGLALTLALALALAWPAAAAEPGEEAASFVRFLEEAAGNCTARGGKRVLVQNGHPVRAVRVWLERYVGGSGTGDRSRSELGPAGPPEPLGCSTSLEGAPQEWRVARAMFVD